MKVLKLKSIPLCIFFFMFCNIFTTNLSGFWFSKQTSVTATSNTSYKKTGILLGVASVVFAGVCFLAYKSFFAKDDVLEKGHVMFHGVEYDVNDDGDWAQLKIQWPYGSSEKKDVIAQEKENVLKDLSDAKKDELAFEEGKFKINKIEEKIKEAEKISDVKWQEAIQLVQKYSQYKPHIGKILQEQKAIVETSARVLKRVKEKLYSKEKDISPQEWEHARKAIIVLPSYDENFSKVLKKDLAHVLKYAKLIDSAYNDFCNEGSAVKLKMVHGKLPEYRSFLRSVKV